MAVTVYCLIVLHNNRGCTLIVVCWKPFHRCCSRFSRKWELKGSVMSAFSSFILLSYCKFCSVSLRLTQQVKFIQATPLYQFVTRYTTMSNMIYTHISIIMLFFVAGILGFGIVSTLAFFLLIYQIDFSSIVFTFVESGVHCYMRWLTLFRVPSRMGPPLVPETFVGLLDFTYF